MNKITTADCQIFLSSHYGEKRIDTRSEKWILIKKYKNFKGLTCRDFEYKDKSLKAVVVLKKENNTLFIIENEDFSYFIDELDSKSLFYYTPVMSSFGVGFYFIKAILFDSTEDSIDFQYKKQKQHLQKKLLKHFNQGEILILDDMLVIFNKDFESVVRIMEKSALNYHDKVSSFVKKNELIPFEFDLSLMLEDFPEYKNLNTEQSISLIFNLVSTNKSLTDFIYSQIKCLLKNIPLEELFSLESIINGFRTSEDKKLESVIKSVILNKQYESMLNEQ